MFGSAKDFYQSDLQSPYALWIVPLVFLFSWLRARPNGSRAVDRRAISFMNTYAPLFVIETVVDPWVTGPLIRYLALGEAAANSLRVPFVLLGDFRVYLLVFYLMAPDRGVPAAVVRAALWTFLVPIASWLATEQLMKQHAGLPSQTLWIVYEIFFFLVAMGLASYLIPAREDRRNFELEIYLQKMTKYVALYYALWAIADLAIFVGGYDLGWALRVVPNQLYYSFWVPLAYYWFFAPRYAAASRPVHAVR